MAKIFLSLAGDGRGHATRMRAVIESLREEHRITVFTSDRAFAFLSPLYRHSEVHVRRIASLRFGYKPDGRIRYWKTGWGALRYLQTLPSLVALLQRVMERERPDLVVTDFEPALPRAARRVGIPFISLNHQHFLLTYDLSSLPVWLRLHALYMGWIVRAYYSGQAASLVSSFYFPPLRKGVRNVTQIGVLLRREIAEARPMERPHLLAYFRRYVPEAALNALRELPVPVRVYGLGQRPSSRNLEFLATSDEGFVEDLIECRALISTAGNQLVGEALHLGKPVFAMPEAGNYEQYINAHYLAECGGGEWSEVEQVHADRLRTFLSRLDSHRCRIPRERLNGLPQTLQAIRWHLRNSNSRSSATHEVVATA